MSTPQVTVLLPVHNGERFLAESIGSLLRQSFEDFELLVIDDGSTDRSRDVALGFRDRRIRVEENPSRLGLIAALNHGLRLARADLVARQDADDTAHPERLERQLAFLREHPAVALLGTEAQAVDAHGRYRREIWLPREHASIRWYLLFDNAFVHSSVVFRKDAVLHLGGYPEYAHCEDYQLWSRVTAVARVANLPGALVVRRVHSESVLRSLEPDGVRAADACNRRVISANLAATFGPHCFSQGDAAVAALLRTGVPPGRVSEFRGLFRRLLAAYASVEPTASRTRDFHRTLALQHAQLTYALLGHGRVTALRSALACLREAPWVLPQQAAQLALASLTRFLPSRGR